MNTMKSGLRTVSHIFNVFSKISIIFLVCFGIITIFMYSINKNRGTTTYDPVKEQRKLIHENLKNPEYSKTKDGKAMVEIYRLSMCGLLGEACTNVPADGDKYFSSSLFGRLSGAISFPYANPPASGAYWAYSGLQKAGFAPNTYAAEGVGFAAIKSLGGIWQLFRDISFSAIVIYLVVAGFLIMFRFKINAQTIVSIENTLPRIFITLLLITFSFAIAGFMIDIMYVVSGLAVSIVGGYSPAQDGQPYLSAARQASLVTKGGAWRIFDEIFINWRIIGLGWDFFHIAPTAINTTLRAITSYITIALLRKIPFVDQLITGSVARLEPWAAGIPQFILAIIMGVVGFFVLTNFAPLLLGLLILVTTGLFVFIRILALVFSAYLRLILNIIFAPMILILGVLPGRNAFANWLKILLADLVVFPIVMVMIVLAGIMAKIPIEEGNFWQPPFLFSSINPGAFRAIVSVGIMFLIPQVVKSIRGLLGIKPSSFGFGPALFLAGMAGIGGAGMGAMGKYGSIAHGLQYAGSIPGLGKLLGKAPPASSGGTTGAHAVDPAPVAMWKRTPKWLDTWAKK